MAVKTAEVRDAIHELIGVLAVICGDDGGGIRSLDELFNGRSQSLLRAVNALPGLLDRARSLYIPVAVDAEPFGTVISVLGQHGKPCRVVLQLADSLVRCIDAFKTRGLSAGDAPLIEKGGLTAAGKAHAEQLRELIEQPIDDGAAEELAAWIDQLPKENFVGMLLAHVDDQLAGVAAGKSLTQAGNDKGSSAQDLEPHEKAMALLVKHKTDWTLEEYASEVGVSRSTIYRSPEWKPFRDAMALMRRPTAIPRGSKTKDGIIEAIDYEEE